MSLDLSGVRAQFPALQRQVNGRPAAYLDGPAGTQVHESVIEAMAGFMRRGGSNVTGTFITSEETEAVTHEARRAIADLFNASTPEQIAFGQNMTSITLAVSRALADTWADGDNIVLTRLDHDANAWPWVMAAAQRGVDVRWLDFDPGRGCALDFGGLDRLLDARTKLVAVTHASNAVGTVVDVAAVTKKTHETEALVYVDAVHYTPHGLIDVQATGCDFLVASGYKFFGPHVGVFYGRTELLEDIDAYKIRPAPDSPPGKWETGTQSFESLAGLTAAVDYVAGLVSGSSRRERVAGAMAAIGSHEEALADRFLAGLAEMPAIKLFGLNASWGRTPTFAIDVDGVTAQEVATRLGQQGIFVWAGHYYAVEVMERLGVLESGGLVRIGFVHYNTADEVDRALNALGDLTL